MCHCESVDSGLLDTTVESFDRHFAVNARATWLLIREFGRRFRGPRAPAGSSPDQRPHRRQPPLRREQGRPGPHHPGRRPRARAPRHHRQRDQPRPGRHRLDDRRSPRARASPPDPARPPRHPAGHRPPGRLPLLAGGPVDQRPAPEEQRRLRLTRVGRSRETGRRRPTPLLHMTATEMDITEDLIRDLLREQHPDLADRPLKLGALGWDNQPLAARRRPRRPVAVGDAVRGRAAAQGTSRHSGVGGDRTPPAVVRGRPGGAGPPRPTCGCRAGCDVGLLVGADARPRRPAARAVSASNSRPSRIARLRDPQPHQEDDDARHGPVRLVVRAEVRDVEREAGGGDQPDQQGEEAARGDPPEAADLALGSPSTGSRS